MPKSKNYEWELIDIARPANITQVNTIFEAVDEKVAQIENKSGQSQITAETALTTATAAKDTALSAQNVASSASLTANEAVQTADTAQNNANSVLGIAQAANSNAATAQSVADSAQSVANEAQVAASNAQVTANTALTNAATAQTAANNANTNANGREPAFIREWAPTPTGSTFPQGALVRHNGRLWQNVNGTGGGSAPGGIPDRWQEVVLGNDSRLLPQNHAHIIVDRQENPEGQRAVGLTYHSSQNASGRPQWVPGGATWVHYQTMRHNGGGPWQGQMAYPMQGDQRLGYRRTNGTTTYGAWRELAWADDVTNTTAYQVAAGSNLFQNHTDGMITVSQTDAVAGGYLSIINATSGHVIDNIWNGEIATIIVRAGVLQCFIHGVWSTANRSHRMGGFSVILRGAGNHTWGTLTVNEERS